MQRECSMGADQAFDRWLSAWTNEHIVPALEGVDFHYMAKRLAAELIQSAKGKGFGEQLEGAVKPYRSVVKYVTHLMWEADYNSVRSRYSSESGDA
jgi:hypothetical protein